MKVGGVWNCRSELLEGAELHVVRGSPPKAVGDWNVLSHGTSLGLQRHPQKVFGPSKPTPNTF